MGWFGYNTYGGDGTQSCHYNYLVWSKVFKNDDAVMDSGVLDSLKTKLNKQQKVIFSKNWKKVFSKIDRKKIKYDDDAIQIQMLAAIFIDNELSIPKKLYKKLEIAIDYLLGQHSDEFDKPFARRNSLKKFLKQAKKLTKNK